MTATPSSILSQISTHQKAGQDNESIALIDECLQDNGTTTTLLLARACSLLKLGRGDEAKADLDRAAGLPSANPALDERYYVQALRQLAAEDHEQVIPVATAALANLPDSTMITFAKGRAHHKLGQVDEAIACYSRTIELDAAHSAAHVARATLISRDGNRVEEAIALAQAHLPDVAAEHHSALALLLGKLHARQGDFSAAAATYADLLEKDPSVGEAHFGLISAHEKRQDGDQALATVAQAEALLGPSKELQTAKARVLSSVGRRAEAIDLYQGLLDPAAPELALVHALSGALINEKQLKEGLAVIDLGLQHHPADFRLTLAAARASLRLGDHDSAQRHYLSACSLQPADENAAAELKKLETAMAAAKSPATADDAEQRLTKPAIVGQSAGLTISISDLNPRSHLTSKTDPGSASSAARKQPSGFQQFFKNLFR